MNKPNLYALNCEIWKSLVPIVYGEVTADPWEYASEATLSTPKNTIETMSVSLI